MRWLRSLLAAVDDAQSIALVLGVSTLAYGAHQVYAPAGWLVVGAVLVWLGLPTRPFPVVFVRDGKAQE